MTSIPIETLLHFSNVFYLISYLVKDILWLRLISIFAGLFMIGYFLMLTPILYPPIFWNGAFILINLVQSIILIRFRIPVTLTAEESAIHRRLFFGLTTREAKLLLDKADWRSANEGEPITAEGEKTKELLFLTSGRMEVKKGDAVVAELLPGRLVGEVSYLTGDLATASVFAKGNCQYVAWDFNDLRNFSSRNRRLQLVIEAMISNDLISKLN